jgi:putative membrane protein
VPDTGFGGAAGIVLTLTGTLMGALAEVRSVRAGRAIESCAPGQNGARVDLALAGLMVALGIALVIYLAHALLAGI